MNVHLIRTPGFPSAELSSVFELLQGHQGPIEFKLGRKALVFRNQDFPWVEFFAAMSDYRTDNHIPKDDIVVCITELRNRSNWFSAFDPEGTNNIFVHGEEWDYYVYSERMYPIAFEVVTNLLQRLLFDEFEKHDGHPLIHDEPTGCINDMCAYKPDIGFKMRTADICNDCLEALEHKLNDRELLRQAINILEVLRRGMLSSRVYLKPLSFEEYLPFSVAITKRKMGMTSQPFRKFLMMIDHFDSLIRTAVIMLANLYLVEKSRVESFFSKNELDVKPALGTWVKALAELSELSNDSETFSLPSNFRRKIDGILKLEQEKKIVALRNEMRGHGYISCEDEEYEDEYVKNLPVLDEIEKSLAALFHRFHYYYVRKADHLGDRRFRINHISLSGSNPAFLETESEIVFDSVNDIPAVKNCYLVTPNRQKWVSVNPYLVYRTCPECKHMRLMIQDGEVYLDPLIGHRVTAK